MGELGSIPGLGRSPGEGKGYPLQYSSLENSMDCIGPGPTKSRTRLSDFHFIIVCIILKMYKLHSFLLIQQISGTYSVQALLDDVIQI